MKTVNFILIKIMKKVQQECYVLYVFRRVFYTDLSLFVSIVF